MDNCSGQSKNNAVLQFLGVLVLAKKCKSCSLSFLRVGHTHEDIDQLFSRLARYIRKHCPVLETIDDFVKAISKWSADMLHRPFESRRYVWKLDNARHWKPWLQKMLKVVTGIGGPTAPHVFNFQRGEGSRGQPSAGEDEEGQGEGNEQQQQQTNN
eukprot:7882029-Pyramimonas_sp.AAC.2